MPDQLDINIDAINSRMCATCLSCIDETGDKILFDTGRPSSGIAFVHHTSLDTLLRSVDAGCPICLGILEFQPRLKKCIAEHIHHDPGWVCGMHDHADEVRLSLYAPPPDALGRLKVLLMPNDGLHPIAWFESIPLGNSLKEYREATSYLRSSISTGSVAALDKIAVWAQNCQTHAECERPARTWTPTRLLHIGEIDVRLIHGEQVPEAEPYCTLSYCWGRPGEKDLLLSSSTIDALTRGVQRSILPRTFREVCQLCVRLSVRYIWIDRLCIKQDDKSDWTAEATTMYQVYSHGLYNISADASTDAEGGLFRHRGQYWLDSHLLNLRHRKKRPVEGWEGYAGIYWFDAILRHNRVENAGPLRQRAWTLQERYLARRNIHFGPYEVRWQCAATNVTETTSFNHFFTMDGRSFLGPDYLDFNQTSKSTDVGHKDPKYLQGDWNNICNEYADLDLTYVGDRAIAFHGIAMSFQWHFKCKYLHGCWVSKLPRSILWRPVEPATEAIDCPSWSWMSVRRPIFLSPAGEDEVQKFEISGVIDRRITILCRLRRFHLILLSRGCYSVRKGADRETDILVWPDQKPSIPELDCIAFIALEGYESDVRYTADLLFLEPCSSLPGVYKRFGKAEVAYNKDRPIPIGNSDIMEHECVSYDADTSRHEIYLE